jgi:hypothetical protein
MKSICGANCFDCKYYGNQCKGCIKDLGQPFWCADIFEDKTCPLFKCATQDKGLNHCGECEELPCKLFFDLKDPELSQEEHEKSINKRVKALKNN